jgi:hypothetical protein
VDEIEAKIIQSQRGASRTHSVKFRMSIGVLANAFVGYAKAIEQRIARVRGRVLIVDVADGFYGQTTGFLSPLVSSHAVGYESEPALPLKFVVALSFPVEQRVLIVFAQAADVTQAGDLDSGPNLHCASLDRNSDWLEAMSYGSAKQLPQDRKRRPG